jgi:hypothetical protein
MAPDCQRTTTYACGCQRIFSYTDGDMGWYNTAEKEIYCKRHRAVIIKLEAELKQLKASIASQEYTVTTE